MTSVAIAALTFQRPAGLRALLDGLAALEVPEGVEVRLVLVDNDPEGSAAAVVEAWPAPAWLPVTYQVEPRRGIATARNTSVALARPSDFVLFVDDDEVPEPGWLRALLAVQASTGGDVVFGPVVPTFEEPPPAWVAAGGFFQRPRFADGAEVHFATSNNTLVRTALLEGQPFDVRYDLTGGSDTHLFERLLRGGASIRWAERAVAHETVPASRVTKAWLLRREYRRGLTLSRVLVHLDRSPVRVAKRVGAGVAAVAAGAVAVVVAVVRRDEVAMLKARRKVLFGAGLLAGLVGVRYQEYRKVHGS